MGKPNIIIWDLEVLADMEEVREIFFSIGDWPGRTLRSSINSIITFGFKQLGEKKAHTINAWDFKARWKKDVNDDEAVVREARKILSQADCIVTFNGKGFDLPMFNGRLAFHGMDKLPPIPHIDVREAVKKLFLYSGSLKNTGKFLKCDNSKISTHGEKNLWGRVAKRDVKAQKEMSTYCEGDVLLLEEILERLLPYCKGMPNWNVFYEGEGVVCPSCGSSHLQKRGRHYKMQKRYQRHQCMDCGSWAYENSKGQLLGAL